jgi:hypothetical protein
VSPLSRAGRGDARRASREAGAFFGVTAQAVGMREAPSRVAPAHVRSQSPLLGLRVEAGRPSPSGQQLYR